MNTTATKEIDMATITFDDSLRLAADALEAEMHAAPRDQRPTYWQPIKEARAAREANVLGTLRANITGYGQLYRWRFADGTSFKGRPAYIEGLGRAEDFSCGIVAVDEPRGNSARRRTFNIWTLVAVEPLG